MLLDWAGLPSSLLRPILSGSHGGIFSKMVGGFSNGRAWGRGKKIGFYGSLCLDNCYGAGQT